MNYLFQNQFQKAEEPLQEILTSSQDFGTEAWGSWARGALGVVSIAKGHISQGLKTLEASIRDSSVSLLRMLSSECITL